jgi:hypothetical protein
MTDEYEVTSTSNVSAKVDDHVLSESPGGTTRKIVRAELIKNPENPAASVKVTLVHQKKSRNDQWENTEGKPLSALKAGEAAKFSLDTGETRELIRNLYHLYNIYKVTGVPWGTSKLVVGREEETIRAPAQRAQVIKELLEQNFGEEVWRELVDQNPDLATKLSLARVQHNRRVVLEKFEKMLMSSELGEGDWQKFFEDNKWIFGYGLRYQFLEILESQPHYGGTNFHGREGERGDFLAASTTDDARFTALVEIKRPDTALLDKKIYRKHAYRASGELAGGISQLQVNCREWEINGSRTDANRDELESAEIFTVQPKGVLVIGHTAQLDERDKHISFELLRRNIQNPEILTFDELYDRARFIASRSDEQV